MTRSNRCLAAFVFLTAYASFSGAVLAQVSRGDNERLTAIDVLLLPDQVMLEHAQADNARLRKNYPAGFALDATHHPHITLLQRYVRTEDLDKVFQAVDAVFNRERPAGWDLEAVGYYYLDFNNSALAGIVIEPTPELRRLQQEIVNAVAPFTRPNGTAAAYVTTAAAPGINLPTLDYVNAFVPQRTGKNFNPHVTIGVGQIDFVKNMVAAPFPRFKFKVAGAAVYHLGNFGTAAKELWRWQPVVAAAVTTSKPGIDPLPSWNEGPTKTAIKKFVADVTTPGGPNFVPAHQRIATFDNDGTLWCEMPIYTQCAFAIDRVKQLAPEHPEWKDKQPFKAALENDMKAVIASGELGLVEIVMATHTGITPEKFESIVREWLATARHPRFKRPYTSLAYQPMLELLAYLRANEFKTFIVSGGGIEFMRPWTERVYGIPPYQVVGSSVATKYEMRGDTPILMREPKIDFIDDKQGKPIGINKFIGRRPIAAFGNSDGDYEMLRWTTAGDDPRFGLIVHHTDAVREYAYDFPSPVGQLKHALDEASQRGWSIADMKRDWKVIFPADVPQADVAPTR
jgi:phosphoserine phosphatase/2'-5' RNA ligase